MTPTAALWAAAATAAAPVLRVMLRRRLRRGKEIAGRLAERRGIDPTPRPTGRLLWLHAASVGETVSILPVLTALTARAPDLTVLLTTGTVDLGHAAGAPAGGRAGRRGCCTASCRSTCRPGWRASSITGGRTPPAFVESELWPNLLLASRRRGIPLMLINARMSARSLAGWRRGPGLARARAGLLRPGAGALAGRRGAAAGAWRRRGQRRPAT